MSASCASLSVYPELTDEELGLQCLCWYIQAAAQRYGAITGDAIDGDFAIAVQAQILRCEFEDSVDPRVEKALTLVVNGKHARGGRIFRKYLHDGALSLGAARVAKEEHELRLKGPKAGGKTAADKNKALDAQIAAVRDDLIRNEVPSRQHAEILAQRFARQLDIQGLSSESQKRRIRRILARTSSK